MVTAVVTINLSATFDTINHEILLEVLSKKFGLQETALKWFENYLRLRSCKVCMESTPKRTNCHSQYLRVVWQDQFYKMPMLQCFKKWFKPLLTYMGLQMITLLRTVSFLIVTLKQKEM